MYSSLRSMPARPIIASDAGPLCSLCSCSRRSDTIRNCSGMAYRNARSSSSAFTQWSPSMRASGAYTSRVSRAIFNCFSGFMCSSVRMLCRRSASLTKITRTSPVIALNISRRSCAATSSAIPVDEGGRSLPFFFVPFIFGSFGGSLSCAGGVAVAVAVAVEVEEEEEEASSSAADASASDVAVVATSSPVRLDNFVSPSTMLATTGPNCRSMDSNVTISVSSTVSCKSAAHSVSVSARSCARMTHTSTGWMMNGSPLFLLCPS
mmetsp:Transcript_13187/g.32865  ORF Transcript_13187/g.32865 Transcript_13187/m.32865 type:complete len:264 (+) Transcript_13187:1972-2763(+)